jgi:PPOX class probable F420-dependent enzyme
MPPESEESALERWPVARLATLRADGRPHLVPVVFARAAGRIWSPVDGKPKRAPGGELARVRNVRLDPRVALLLDAYRADWTRLWWLRIDGEAEVVDAGGAGAGADVAAALAALRAKYPQYEHVPVLAGRPTLLAVREHGRASWCPGPAPPEIGSGPEGAC